MRYTELTATAREKAIVNYINDFDIDYYNGEQLTTASLDTIEQAIVENDIHFTENGNIID